MTPQPDTVVSYANPNIQAPALYGTVAPGESLLAIMAACGMAVSYPPPPLPGGLFPLSLAVLAATI